MKPHRRIPRVDTFVAGVIAMWTMASLQSCDYVKPYPTDVAEVDWGRFRLAQGRNVRVPRDREEGPFFLFADIVGPAEKELLVPVDAGMEIVTRSGEVNGTIAFDHASWRPLAVTDWDGDGKDDLLLGSRAPPGVTIRAVNGRDRIISEITPAMSGDAIVQALRVDGDTLLFTAFPINRSAPRLIGALSLADPQRRARTLTIGPLPVEITPPVRHADGGIRYGIGVRAALQGSTGYTPAVFPEPDRLYPLLVRVSYQDRGAAPDIAVEVGRTVGPSVRHGYPRSHQISRLIPRSIGWDEENEPETVILLERLSQVYGGSSAVELHGHDDEVRARHTGPSATRGELRLFVGADGERLLLVGWSRTGELVVIDSDGGVVRRRRLPGAVHDLRIRQTEGGGPPFLVTSGERVWVLNETLDTVWTAPTEWIVQQALLVADDRGTEVYLFGRSFMQYTFEELNGTADDPEPEESSMANRIVDTAPRRYGRGGDDSARRSVTLPEGFSIHELTDMDGDGERDFLLRNSTHTEYRVLSADGRIVGEGALPRSFDRWGATGDIDGDGSIEIVGTFSDDDACGLLAFSALAPAGNRLRYVNYVTYGYDGCLQYLGHWDDLALLRMVSGYMLSPRGIYGIDAATGAVRFFRPTAAFAHTPSVRPDGIHFTVYTPSNGATVSHVEGWIESDSYFYRHILDRNGAPLPTAGPLPEGVGQGGGRWFFFDGDADGEEERYLVIQKDPDFYPGTPTVYRVDHDGSLAVIYHGPPDSGSMHYPIRTAEENVLFIQWTEARRLDLLDGFFRLRGSWDLPEGPIGPVFQVTPDGEAALAVGGEDSVLLWEPRTGRRRRYPFLYGELRGYLVEDIDSDGIPEIILVGEEHIEIVWT
ncbi:MAG: VCBS repeat-containing protein [Spirochaetales bacterium]|nr:VCBS repeat-containing protein [Spirochaetales bacterium]